MASIKHLFSCFWLNPKWSRALPEVCQKACCMAAKHVPTRCTLQSVEAVPCGLSVCWRPCPPCPRTAFDHRMTPVTPSRLLWKVASSWVFYRKAVPGDWRAGGWKKQAFLPTSGLQAASLVGPVFSVLLCPPHSLLPQQPRLPHSGATTSSLLVTAPACSFSCPNPMRGGPILLSSRLCALCPDWTWLIQLKKAPLTGLGKGWGSGGSSLSTPWGASLGLSDSKQVSKSTCS